MNSEVEYNPVILAALKGNKQNYPNALAKMYPRIFNKVIKLWGSPQFDLYVRELMLDDRGTRQGFPPSVGYDILYLALVHSVVGESAEEREIRERKDDPWRDMSLKK